jgi:sugar lactone lactonase YvrE
MARGAELASPWDLERKGTQLFIANAGTHQIGVLDLVAGTLAALAGDGGEALVDGPARQARLAQPSGLALSATGTELYFADSETSSVRALNLQSEQVETLVGTGLFDFGSDSGAFESAQLQHPLGLCSWSDPSGDGRLVVADSYNAALRVLDLETREVRDLDDGLFCDDPVCLPLAEPAGVWTDGPHRLLVSDTNNHRVLEYRPAEARYRTWSK